MSGDARRWTSSRFAISKTNRKQLECAPETSSARRSRAVHALAPRYATGDDVGGAQRLRQSAVESVRPDQCFRLRYRQTGTLNVNPSDRLHRSGPFDEPPLPSSTPNMTEQSVTDFFEIRKISGNDDHGTVQNLMQPVYVDDVESGESDALKQNGLKLRIKARAGDQSRQCRGRVRPISPHFSRQDAV